MKRLGKIIDVDFVAKGEDVFDVAGREKESIWLQKFSSSTARVDAHDVPSSANLPLEVVWRAKVGRKSSWSYGISAKHAMQRAIEERRERGKTEGDECRDCKRKEILCSEGRCEDHCAEWCKFFGIDHDRRQEMP